ncbi:MAG: gephyrin-like molybdotransferase Glp [Gemmatimonadota bacterium]
MTRSSSDSAGPNSLERSPPLDPERALELILQDARPLGLETVPLDEADGRAAARDVRARAPLPAWDNSAKDGYAVRASDLAGAAAIPGAPVGLGVAGEVAAGEPPGAGLPPGTTLRIMTGAPLPAGADAVVPVEETAGPGGDGAFAATGERVAFSSPPVAGANVRRAGADVASGERVLRAGETLTPGRVALLAALGLGQVDVTRRPRVLVIPTGDELVEPGGEAPPGRLYSSNAHGLAALARRAGCAARALPIVPDDPLRIRAAVHEALLAAEVVLTSGGVSAGRHDHVRGVLAEAAGGLVFQGVRMRPGQPLVFARTADLPGVGRVDTRYLFGLPGNPTSALVTCLEFVRPLLRRLAGFSELFLPTLRARLTEPVRSEAGRRSFLRVRLQRDGAGGFTAAPAGDQGSGHLRPLADAHGLLVCGPERTQLGAGEEVLVQLLGDPPGASRPWAP